LATNERFMPVPPEAVWAALADAGGYGYWVVGSKEIRAADAGWPAPGTKIHHTVGFGPLRLSDHTEVLESRRPQRLQLRAKGRPFGTARVTLELAPRDGGTDVSITERPDGATAVLNLNPLVHVLTKLRNSESLMRLEELAERHAA
jgi:uncharacterized protein YndB with AHSA1/START domain